MAFPNKRRGARGRFGKWTWLVIPGTWNTSNKNPGWLWYVGSASDPQALVQESTVSGTRPTKKSAVRWASIITGMLKDGVFET